MPAGGHAMPPLARLLSGLAGAASSTRRVWQSLVQSHAAGHVLQSGRIGAVAAEGSQLDGLTPLRAPRLVVFGQPALRRIAVVG